MKKIRISLFKLKIDGSYFSHFFPKVGYINLTIESEFSSYVYILACSDDSYYTGVTNDIERRLYEHDDGLDPESYTYIRRPLVLKYLE